jgi:FtsP/CotA-like multicopper oxidase with cupredoxin domain
MVRHTPLLLLIGLCLAAGTALAAVGGERGTGGEWDPPATQETDIPRPEPQCPNEHPGWREAQTVMGVPMQSDPHCQPDNPELVAAFVKGTNHVNQSTLDELALNEEAVEKCCDRDGDGDPDVVNITIEALEINGFHLKSDDLATPYNIAPGIHPTFWSFAPKSTIDHAGEAFRDIARQPSPPMRVEAGDEVNLELENTHYFPHTVHLHGVDHGFQDADGEGNDGVPGVSEAPVRPGENRTYNFQPRQAGTMFYHCHVQPDVHVAMGLTGILRVEEERDNNTVQTFNPGAGLVRHPAEGVKEDHDRQYDYHYQNVDKELHEIPQKLNDPRELAREMHREYDSTGRDADYFLLNGRSFPYTARESNIVLAEDETALVHMLSGGEDTHSIHTHGHKPTIVAKDGVRLEEPVQRDVFSLTAAQRLDIVINGTDNGLDSYGQGTWFMHDHREEATTTDGINPGGDISMITYESYWNETTNMPEHQGSWDLLFTPEYYEGQIPVFQDLGMPSIFGDVAQTDDADSQDGTLPIPIGPLAPVALLAAGGLARRRLGGGDR